MAFLFKSKKQPSGGPASASRSLHSSDGSGQNPGMNGFSEKPIERDTSTPVSSVNNSLNSLGGDGAVRPPEQQWRRERADSDSTVSIRTTCANVCADLQSVT